jgi:5-formyltetrahydrofolate cyclo-ligase
VRLSAGRVREDCWNQLLSARVVGYPLPPHGRYPNFHGSAEAARQLMGWPALQRAREVLVGSELVLRPLRRQLLQLGALLWIPDPKRGGYLRSEGSGARGSQSWQAQLGRPEVAVLASVAASRQGERLSKGFGWGAEGAGGCPQATLVHPLTLFAQLPCPPDSTLAALATPEELLEFG